MGYNVFEDMGFNAESAQNLKLRTSLMIGLREYIKS
jgi:predicted XRE-type DNA-binding protein